MSDYAGDIIDADHYLKRAYTLGSLKDYGAGANLLMHAVKHLERAELDMRRKEGEQLRNQQGKA